MVILPSDITFFPSCWSKNRLTYQINPHMGLKISFLENTSLYQISAPKNMLKNQSLSAQNFPEDTCEKWQKTIMFISFFSDY